MGRPQEQLDRDGTPVRELAFWLRDLRNSAGLTYEQLGREAHYATSTVQGATAGKRLPTLRVTMAIVRACGGDERAWRAYWTRIRRLLDDEAPAGIDRSVTPPWAESALSGLSGTAAAADWPPLAGLDDWYIERFSALLRVDSDPVEALEWRRIVATRDGLSQLVTSVSMPRRADDAGNGNVRELESELLYGGSIEACQQPYDSYFEHVITLPRPLRSGERHEYLIRVRIPARQPMTPHYTHIPFRRSDHFEVRVRFDPRRLPEAAWVLRGAPTAVIYGGEPLAGRLIPDRFGVVHASFSEMRPGLGYGIRWREVARIMPGS